MRKEGVWKQALALVLSAAMVFGNVSPVSAAAGDTAGSAGAATGGTAGDSSVVENPDAYKELKFDFEDGQQEVSGDDALYIENGITFLNQCSQDVVTDDDGNEIESDNNPNKSKGAEVVDASTIPNATEADKAHGKVLKLDKGKTNPQLDNDGNIVYDNNGNIVYTQTAGIDYLTTTEGALASYDYSNGVTFSFDIRPEGQRDWNYLFAFGMFGDVKYAVTGTLGFIAGYDSDQKKQDAIDKDGSWQAFFPGGNWLPGNEIVSGVDNPADAWNFFGEAYAERNAHKWYNMKYIYTKAGLTIEVNGVPTVTYNDANGYMEGILQNMSKGQLRIGKGAIENFEGFIGYMDNVSIQPVHLGAHDYVAIEGGTVPADCTTPGSRKVKCSMCGVVDTQVIPPNGHTYNHVDAKAATCTESGNIEHYRCSACSGYFVSGDDGVQTVTSKTVTLGAPGHDYNEVVSKKATAAADGEITKTCKNCTEGTTGHVVKEAIAKASNIALVGASSYTYTGKKITPQVTVKDSAGKDIGTANYTVTYGENTKAGTGTVTVTFKGDKYTGSVTKNFTITAAASLKLNKTKVTLYTGKASKTITIKPTVTGASQTVSWTTSNKKVATVKNGKITAVGKGTATITAKANGISQTVKVTVKNPTITIKNGKKAVKKNTVTVKKKKSVKLTVSVSPKNSGSAVKALSKKDKKIATVSYKKGKLTIKGKKKGTVKVKITSGKTTKTLTVKVK